MLKGIQYLTDTTGKRTAVLIDLGRWGKNWEDIEDALVADARMKESAVSWKRLKAEGKKKR